LFDITDRCRFGAFPEDIAANYVTHVCKALVYLQEHHIVHRDIKAANLLITNDGICKLGDFGVAIDVENTRNTLMRKQAGAGGTPYWSMLRILVAVAVLH
jgi:serine/threonine protein kinase